MKENPDRKKKYSESQLHCFNSGKKCSKPVLPPVTDNDWNEDGRLTWTSEIFPKEVEEILFNDEFDTDDYIDDSGESDDEEHI